MQMYTIVGSSEMRINRDTMYNGLGIKIFHARRCNINIVFSIYPENVDSNGFFFFFSPLNI